MIILDTIKFLVQREHISEILSINDFDLIKVRYLAFEQLLNHFKNDAKKVENELKEMYKSNYYHYKKQFQEFRREYLYETNSILLEIQDKIST